VRIDQFNLSLRHRSAAEAIDLGGVIVDHWRAKILRTWCAAYCPVALVVAVLALFIAPGYALLLLWWAKPLFDRVLLHFYSRAVFGDVPGVRECLGAALATLRTPGLWADLTLRRFALARSFDMPVTLLEGQRAAARSRRVDVLGHNTRGSAVWLTVVCANFSLLVTLTIIATLTLLVPGEWQFDSVSAALGRAESSAGSRFALVCLTIISETLVEPFYMAAGFALYLNRRSDLEGWDLELAFRRMSERLGRSAVILGAALFAGCLALSAAGGEGVALAAEPAVQDALPGGRAPLQLGAPRDGWPDAMESSGATIKKVLKDPDFGHDEVHQVWSLRFRDTSKPTLWHVSPMWQRFFEVVGVALEWLARIVVGTLLLLVLYFLARHLLGQRGWGFASRRRPEFLGELDVRAESLPADPVAEARRLIRAGEARRALSLLYRACLVALIDRAHIEFKSGDTEGRCLARAEGRVPRETLDYLRSLCDAWLVTAYAHQPPANALLDALCERWATYFGSGAVLAGTERA
jgi:hypothetical protein